MTPLLYTNQAHLPTEVQEWLDRQAPLPAEVNFYPVKTKSWAEVIPWFLLAFFFLAMGTAAPITFLAQFMRDGFTARTGYFLFGTLFLAIFLLILLYGLLAGAIQDAKLIRAKQQGHLRHGIFVTTQDILIRLPHELHYLPRYSVVDAAEITIQRGSRFIKAIKLTFTDPIDAQSELVIRPKLSIPTPNLLPLLRIGKTESQGD